MCLSNWKLWSKFRFIWLNLGELLFVIFDLNLKPVFLHRIVLFSQNTCRVLLLENFDFFSQPLDMIQKSDSFLHQRLHILFCIHQHIVIILCFKLGEIFNLHSQRRNLCRLRLDLWLHIHEIMHGSIILFSCFSSFEMKLVDLLFALLSNRCFKLGISFMFAYFFLKLFQLENKVSLLNLKLFSFIFLLSY